MHPYQQALRRAWTEQRTLVSFLIFGLVYAFARLVLGIEADPMFLLLGPTATELREQAAAKFKEASELIGEKKDEEIDADLEKQFNATMEEAKGLHKQYVEAAGREGTRVELREALDFYHGKAKGVGIDWTKTSAAPPHEGLPHYDGGLWVPDHMKSLGQAFVESEEYKELGESGVLNSDNAKFKTRPIGLKATTDIVGGTSAAGATGAGPGSALITPQFLPGILPLPQQPLTVRDLFSQATTATDTISYARQASFESGAAAVAEAATDGNPTGAKPQSSISWSRQTAVVETIATWMAATRKQLSDAGQTRSLIDNQGRLMIQLEEEDQLLNGDGTAPNISGLLDQTGLQTLDLSAALGSRANLDGLRTAKRLVRTGAARAVADGVVMHPSDSEEFDLMVDDQGRYRAGDPFGILGPTSDAPPIWRMRRVESEAVTEGTAIVGGFRIGATVFEREGLQTFTSDSHSDFFIRNLIAILFEERLGLAVFFPAAFVVVTLKDWDALT